MDELVSRKEEIVTGAMINSSFYFVVSLGRNNSGEGEED